MKRLFLILGLMTALCSFTFSQGTGNIIGTVTDKNSDNPIPFANVALIFGGNVVTGSTADFSGKYIIRAVSPETYTLRVTCVDYQIVEIQDIVIGADKTVLKDVILQPTTRVLNAVKIVANSVPVFESVQTSSSSVVMADESRKVSRQNSQKETLRFQAVEEDYDAEEYDAYAENRFLTAKEMPLSTFSLDVDAASYSKLRRIINQGQLPEKDAVRTEELINYFSYDYPQPTGKDPVYITTETATCPWNNQHQLVRIGVKAKEIPSDKLPASNFVFLIDVSGSMYGATRLELVKSSLKLLSNNLRDQNRVAIMVYAGAAGEVLPSTSGSDRQKIVEALENLTVGGSTAGGAGITLAYKIAEKNFISNGNNRIILCTDGDFNVGVSSNTELESLIESKRKSGVFLTVLGYGMGNYKDSKLQTLAQKGNGNHAYTDNIQEANKVLVQEFGSTMYTVAKDVKIQVEFNSAYVSAYRLVGYESRLLNKEDFNDDTKDAGELGSGHTVTALYEIIPVGVKNNYGGVDKLKYQKENEGAATSGVQNSELLTVKLRYKNPDEDQSSKMEVPVSTAQLNQKTPKDFKFIMAVAMFGQLLKDSDFKGDATYQKAIDLAREGIGEDQHGYRKEFIRLAEATKQMAPHSNNIGKSENGKR